MVGLCDELKDDVDGVFSFENCDTMRHSSCHEYYADYGGRVPGNIQNSMTAGKI